MRVVHKRAHQKYHESRLTAIVRCGNRVQVARTSWLWKGVTCKRCRGHDPLAQALGWWYRNQWREAQIPRRHASALQEHDAIEYDESDGYNHLTQTGKGLMEKAGYTEDTYGCWMPS